MSCYDEELKSLRAQIAGKKSAEAKLESLKAQKSELLDKVYALRTQKKKV